MIGFMLGSKQKQSQRFNQNGERIPTTFINMDPCYVVDIRHSSMSNGYTVKLGFGSAKNIKKPVQGELKKAGIQTPLRFLKEARSDMVGEAEQKLSIGEKLKPSLIFKVGEKVNITGRSKGKGFQGVVRRHKFAGGFRTHGQSDRERAPGSIGQTTTPGRVYKGKRMAGRMGNSRVMVKNLEIVEVNETGIFVKGLVPGAQGGLIEIRRSTS